MIPFEKTPWAAIARILHEGSSEPGFQFARVHASERAPARQGGLYVACLAFSEHAALLVCLSRRDGDD